MSDSKTEYVVLRTGEKVQKHIARAYWRVIRTMYDEHPFALSEALMVARKPKQKPAGDIGIYLRERGILDQNGEMPPVVREIILSSISGVDILDMRLVQPFKGAS